MNKIQNNQYLTYDDVSIIPKFSTISHRASCDIRSKITKTKYLNIPIISSPMDTITEYFMAYEMWNRGGLGVVHRFLSMNKQISIIQNLREDMQDATKSKDACISAAIGISGDYLERAQELVHQGCNILFLDVAHGHHNLVREALIKLHNISGPFEIIGGNIVTKVATRDLCEWGCDGLRVGLGNGALCETRLRTGVGIPQITALIDCVEEADKYSVPIIADGGIRYIGDVAKALGCGADTVMIGSLLSGTKETPGEISKVGKWPNEMLYKKYRGSASLDSKIDRGEDKNVEGNSLPVPYKGKVKRIINDICDGLKSSMSYVGATTIEEFQALVEFVRVTEAGRTEALPHLLK